MLSVKRINTPWQIESPPVLVAADPGRIERHKNIEIMLMLSGRSLIYYDHALFRCARGDVFYFFSDIPHSALPYAGDCEQLWLWPGSSSIFAARLVCTSTDGYSTQKRMMFGKQMFCPWLADSLQVASPQNLPRARLMGMILLLACEYTTAIQSVCTDRPAELLLDRQRADIADICHYIDTCYGVGATLEKLARMANYSKYHFARLFRQQTGMTVHQRIDQARGKRMIELSRHGASVKEIAAALGFSSSSAYALWKNNYSLCTRIRG